MCDYVPSTWKISAQINLLSLVSALGISYYLVRAELWVLGNSPSLGEFLELGMYHASLDSPPFLPWLPSCQYWSLSSISQQPLVPIYIMDPSLSSSDNASPCQHNSQTSGSCRLGSTLYRVPCGCHRVPNVSSLPSFWENGKYCTS